VIAQIEVEQEIAKRLSEQASARGLSVEVYLRTLLDNAAVESEPKPLLTPQEKASAFLEWANGHHLSVAPLSDEAVSRDSIYTREDEQL